MKKNFFILISVAVILLNILSCEKEMTRPPEIEVFIDQLKMGNYPGRQIPQFALSQIPQLLEYRNEREMIQSFPVNPLSSYYLEECRLGVYVLWTIEYIRKSEKGETDALLPWPSLSPVLIAEDPLDVAGPEFTDQEFLHNRASEAYFSWWEGKRNISGKDFVNMNPLEGSGIRWW